MTNPVTNYFSRGFEVARNNQQIAYTLLLMIVIPLAFFWSGGKFLQTANDNQERVEMASIGFMQDTFVTAAEERMNDSDFLKKTVESIKAKDDRNMITAFTVVKLNGGLNGTSTIVASLDPLEVGKSDAPHQPIVQQLSGTIRTTSTITPIQVGNERHWLAYRGINDTAGEMIGYVITDISMKNFDDIALQGMTNAYISLVIVLLFIFVLLMRQARIIDYTVLYQRLKEVDQMKDDFLSMAAHELRTPLTIIRGYVDLLRGAKNLEEKDTENLRRIDVSAQQLNALVGDILDISRLEQGRMKFDFAETDLDGMIKTMMDSFAPVAKEKGLALSYEAAAGLPKIFVDPIRLQQALTNLIGNAIKYTPSGSVTVKTYLDDKKKVTVRVSDTGMGISAEDQKQLFSKFYRVKSKETDAIQGTGLGLWITHRIVGEMKGTITVESIKGKGSDFIVSFPAVASL